MYRFNKFRLEPCGKARAVRVSLLISPADSSRLVIYTIEENFEAEATVGMDENEGEEDDDE